MGTRVRACARAHASKRTLERRFPPGAPSARSPTVSLTLFLAPESTAARNGRVALPSPSRPVATEFAVFNGACSQAPSAPVVTFVWCLVTKFSRGPPTRIADCTLSPLPLPPSHPPSLDQNHNTNANLNEFGCLPASKLYPPLSI
eukprot:493301-Pleurochrysis_carterae.AAC.1